MYLIDKNIAARDMAERAAQLQAQAVLPATADDALVIDTWLRTKRSPHTRDAYGRDVRRLLVYTDRAPLRSVTLPMLLDFAGSLAALAPESQRRIVASIKSLLAFAQKSGYLPVNVGAAWTASQPADRLSERILTEEQVQRMLALEYDYTKRLLLRVLYASGGRVSEICALRWRHVQARGDDAGQLVLYGKGEKTRVVPLSAALWQDLYILYSDDPEAPVFRTRTGQPYARSRVHRIVREASQRAGLPAGVSPHWLRHAHASHALDRGAPISLVKETLGHANVRTTDKYLHARPDDGSSLYLSV